MVAALGAACTVVDTTGGGSEAPDATTTTTVPTGTTPAPAVDASADAPSPTDAASGDAAAGDGAPGDSAVADAADGATNDAAMTDASADAADAGAISGPVLPGVDGVLRGTVAGTREHSWIGTLRLPSAACPAGARTVTQGMVSCCVWSGGFSGTSSAPVTFDLTTATGTLAGSPIGPLGAATLDVDGTMRFRQPTLLHAVKGWDASIAISARLGAPASTLAGAEQLLRPTALVAPVSDSLRNMQVTWNPTTKVFRITLDLTMFQNTTAGACPIPPGPSAGRLIFDLR